MFGPDLLVALVIYEGARPRELYLPRGPLGRMPGQTMSSRAVRPSLPIPRSSACRFI
jgi:hypothetical protein